MKRIGCLVLAAALAMSLWGCSGETRIEGRVAALRTDESGALTGFVVEGAGKQTGILLAERSRIWPRGEGSWTEEALRKEIQVDAMVRVSCYSRGENLETAEGKIPACWAQDVQITGRLEREVRTLRDGTPVDRVDRESVGTERVWQLADGTELLCVRDFLGLEAYQVMGVEMFENLGERVQEKIRAYYEERGALYDEPEELERAYAAFLEEGADFQRRYIEQRVCPSASNRRLMYFATSLTLPVPQGDGSTVYEIQLGEAFDRETGEKLSNGDLFAVPEEEVRRRLPELAGWADDAALAAEMAEALELEWIVFTPEEMMALIPPQTLPSRRDESFLLSLVCGDALEEFLQPWAIPDGRIP